MRVQLQGGASKDATAVDPSTSGGTTVPKRGIQLQGGAAGNSDSVQTIDSIMSVEETQPKRRLGSATAGDDASSLKGSVVSSSLSTETCSSLEELTELEDDDDQDMEGLESASLDEAMESESGSSEAPSMTPSAVLRSTPFQSLKERFDR